MLSLLDRTISFCHFSDWIPAKRKQIAYDFFQRRVEDLQAVSNKAYAWIKLGDADAKLGKLFDKVEAVEKPILSPPCLSGIKSAFEAKPAWTFSNHTLDRDLLKKYSLLNEKRGSPERAISLLSMGFEESLELVCDPSVAAEIKAGLMDRSGALEWVEKLKALRSGEQILFIGGTNTVAAQLKLPYLHSDPLAIQAQKFLLEDEAAANLAKRLVENASPELGKVLKNGQIADLIKMVLNKRGHFDFGPLSRSLTEGSPLWKRMVLAPAEFVRSRIDGKLKKISDDVYKEMEQKLGVFLTPPVRKELHDLIMSSSGFAPNLEGVMRGFVEKILERGRGSVKELIPMLGDQLPPLVPVMIEHMGYGTLGATKKEFWLEWTRQEDGLFSLIALLPDRKICYKNIAPGKLDESFFCRLLSYQTQNPNVSFKIEEVESNLLTFLGKPTVNAIDSGAGRWGLMNELVKAKGGDIEKAHLLLMRQAFIDLWPEREKHLSLIENQGVWLAKKTEELHEKKKITEEEFKASFATFHEALSLLNSTKKISRGKVFPAGLKDTLNKLFAGIGMTSENLLFIKAVLVDNLGAEAEAAVDALLACVKEELGEITPPPPPPIAVSTISFRDVAYKVRAYATQFFISPMCFAANLAGELFSRCFPTTAKKLKTLAFRCLAKSLSFILLTEEHRELCREAVVSFKNMALQEGKLDFSFKPKPRKLEEINVRVVTGKMDLKPLEKGQETGSIELFSEKVEPVTPANVVSILQHWTNQSSCLDPRQRLLFLNSRLMTLPLPGDGFWEKVDGYEACLEALGEIAFCLHDTDSACSIEQENQCILNLYTLFAIVQQLELSEQNPYKINTQSDNRHVPMSERQRFLALPVGLFYWSEQPNFRMVDTRAANRLNDVLDYLLKLHTPTKWWNQNIFNRKLGRRELVTYIEESKTCCFGEYEGPVNEFYGDERFKSLLSNDVVRERLAELGYDQDTSTEEMVAVLYANPPVGLENGHYRGVLPLPFHTLRIMHRLCNHKMRCFEKRAGVNGLGMRRLADTPYCLQKEGHFIWDRLSCFPFVKGDYQKDSLLSYLRGGYTAIAGYEFNVKAQLRYSPLDLSVSKCWMSKKTPMMLHELDKQMRKKRVTQSEIVNKTEDLTYFSHNTTDRQLKAMRMIFAEDADEPVRVLSLIREDPELLLQQKYHILLEYFLLQGDFLRKQLKECPQFLKTVDLVLMEGIEFLKKRDSYGYLLPLLMIAHIEADTMGLAPPGHIDEILKVYANDRFFPCLVGLAYHFKDPASFSKEEQKRAVADFLRAKNQIDSESFSNEDLGELFNETWKRWEVYIKEELKEPEFRREMLDSFCAMRGYDPDLSLGHVWQGEYPVYSLGQFSIDIRKGVDNGNKEFYSFQIKELLKAFLPAEAINRCTITSLEGGKIRIPDYDLTVEVDMGSGTLQFFKSWQGKQYQWVSKNREAEIKDKISYWMEVSASQNLQMLKLSSGQPAQLYLVESRHKGEYSIVCEESMSGEERLERVPLTNGLAPLTWFQRREEIGCFVSSKKPDVVRSIEFLKMNLKFEVVEGSAECRGAFSGYKIAQNQQHALLASYGRTLLLEKGPDKRVLLPADSLAGAFVNGLGKRFNGVESHLLQTLAESYTPLSQEGYFAYSIDKEGRLVSSDPQAVLHLFCYQLLSGNLTEADFYLKRLEGISKRKKLPEKIGAFALILHSMAAASSNNELINFSLRMAALMEENTALQGGDLISGKEQNLAAFLLIQYNYKSYLENRKFLFRHLTPFQEISIIQALKGAGRSLVEGVDLSNLPFAEGKGVKEALQFSMNFVEEAVLFDVVLQRYQELMTKHAPQIAAGNPFWKRAMQAYLFNSTPDPLANLQDPTLSGSSGKAIEKLLIGGMKSKRLLSETSNKQFVYDETVIPIERLPTEFSKMDAKTVAKHFFSYYALACGKEPDQNKDLFRTKREELKRSLTYLQGAYKDLAIGVPLQILYCAVHSPHRFTLPNPEELLEEYVQKKYPRKMNFLINQCALDLSSSGVFNSFFAFATDWFRPSLSGVLQMSGLSAYYQTGRAVFGVASAFVKAYRPVGVEQVDPLSNEPLDPALAATLQGIDSTIQQTFTHFSSLYLNSKKGDLVEAVSVSETGDSVTDRLIRKTNDSLQDFAARQPQMKHTAKPIDLLPLKIQLKTSASELKSLLDQERAELLQKADEVFHRASDDLAGLKAAGKTMGEKLLDFDALLTGFLKGENSILSQRIYHYLIFATRQAQMERALIKVEKAIKEPTKPNLDAVAGELSQTRSYAFDKMPERLLKGHLLFEYKQNTLVWDKQASQILDMLSLDCDRSFIELIMASGKTFYGIPMTDHYTADGTQIPINIWAASMKRNNIDQIGAQAENVFSQDAYALSFSRSENLTPRQLEGRLLVMLRVLKERGQINMTKEEALALQLIWLEHIPKLKKEKSGSVPLRLMTEILRVFRTAGKAVIDEAHEIFSRLQMLNHPTGRKKKLEECDILVTEQFVRALISPKVVELLDVRTNQRTWKPELYWDKVRPLIADHFAAHFSLPDLKEYLLNEEVDIPDFLLKHPQRRSCSLARGLLNSIAPNTLSRIVSIDFGPGSGKFAIPYGGNNNPKAESLIQNQFEACLKTFLQQITNPFTEENAQELIGFLMIKAEKERELFGLPIDQTAIGKLFCKWCPGQSLERYSIKEVAGHLIRNTDAILMHTRHLIAPQITYYTSHFGGNSQNFASMFKAFFSDTGTPYNEETYPVGTQPIWDKGTVGETVEFLLSRCNKPESIVEIAAAEPAKAIDEILTRLSPKTRAIIDCGAVARGMENRSVAAKVLEGMSGLEGIAFYIKDEKMILENGKVKPFEEGTTKLEKRAAFFDDAHIFAADIPLELDAEGLVTLGENSTLTQVSQALWRMRLIKKGNQSIRLVVSSAVRRLISGDQPCTIRQILQFLEKNEAKQLTEDNFYADYQKISNTLRALVIDKLLFATSESEMIKIYETFEPLLLSQLQDDPNELYGWPIKSIKPEEALEQCKQQYRDRYNDQLTSEELAQVEAEFAKIGHGNYPEAVKVCRKDGAISFEFSESLGQEQVQTIDQQQTEEQQLTQVVEQNLNQVLEGAADAEPDLAEPKPWSNDPCFSLSNLSDPLKKNPLLYPLNQVVAAADLPQLADLAEAFEGKIWVSENFIGNTKGFLSRSLAAPFRKKSKPILEVLIVWSDQGYSIGLLDQKDAAHWREKMKKSDLKLALFDIGTNSIVATGKNPIFEEELTYLMKRDLARIRFLKGSVAFEADQLVKIERWAEKYNPQRMHDLFTALHERFGTAKKTGSPIEQLFNRMEDKELFDSK